MVIEKMLLNVVIKSIDRKTNRVILSYKEMYGTWEESIKEFSEYLKVMNDVLNKKI